MRVVGSVPVRLEDLGRGAHAVEASISVGACHIEDDRAVVVQVDLLVDLLAEVADLDGLLRVLEWLGLLLRVLGLLEGYPRLCEDHLVVLLLYRVVQLYLVLLLNLLLLLAELVHDVGPVLGQAPDEVVVAGEVEAEVELQVLLEADVERRSHPPRPELEVRDLLPAQAFPRCHVRGGQVRVEDYQVHDEELEQNVDREANPSERLRVVDSLGELQSQEHDHEQLDLLEPQVHIEVLPVPFSNTITEPRAVMIVRGNALLAHPAMFRPQRHVQQALRTEPERDLDLPRPLAPLNRREVLLSVLLVAFPALGIVSVPLILDHHRWRAAAIRQGVQMLLYHVLSRTPLHLARVLDGDDLLVEDLLVKDALRGRVDAVVAVAGESQVQVLDVEARGWAEAADHVVVDVLEGADRAGVAGVVVLSEPLIPLLSGLVRVLLGPGLDLAPSVVLVAFAHGVGVECLWTDPLQVVFL